MWKFSSFRSARFPTLSKPMVLETTYASGRWMIVLHEGRKCQLSRQMHEVFKDFPYLAEKNQNDALTYKVSFPQHAQMQTVWQKLQELNTREHNTN